MGVYYIPESALCRVKARKESMCKHILRFWIVTVTIAPIDEIEGCGIRTSNQYSLTLPNVQEADNQRIGKGLTTWGGQGFSCWLSVGGKTWKIF